jgi:DNA-binding SARP family transcriptional activator
VASPTIRLLGSPVVERDGVPSASPRGRKAWAVLGYLLLSEHAVPRRQLAGLLFAEADDPLGALRWTLAQLRRALGTPEALRGDPIVVGLEQATVDIVDLARGDVGALLGASGELLQGLSVDGCPAFESWLTVERYRISSQLEARLRHRAMALLVDGAAAQALPYASRALTQNPLDEDNHELLVRCLAAVGDHEGALRQVAACDDLLRRELGTAASPSLRLAARPPEEGDPTSVGGRSEVESLLEAGRAAVAAGAVVAGLDCLRRAVAKAAATTDPQLHGRSLLVLGGALVHGVRGRDGEGALVLHRALSLAGRTGDDQTVATACRELAFVEVQAGRRTTARTWLERATGLSETDESRAAVLGVAGMNASDMGDYPAAFTTLHESVALARRCGDVRQQAWSLSILARAHLLRCEYTQGLQAVTRSLALVQEQRWMAFLPWPRALKAELDLRTGQPGDVASETERAWTLSCELGDPCWEGMTARLLGLLRADAGDYPGALTWLDEARRRSSSVPDRYQWVRAYVLDALVDVARRAGECARARSCADDLAALAARCEMREFVVRAELHRGLLGDPSALSAARLLAEGLDNPALQTVLDRASKEQPR